jgi:hypothetical protein
VEGGLRLILSVLPSINLLLKHGATLDSGPNGDSPLQRAWQIAIRERFLLPQLLLGNVSSKDISIEYLERKIEIQASHWGYDKTIEIDVGASYGQGVCKEQTLKTRCEVKP